MTGLHKIIKDGMRTQAKIDDKFVNDFMKIAFVDLNRLPITDELRQALEDRLDGIAYLDFGKSWYHMCEAYGLNYTYVKQMFQTWSDGSPRKKYLNGFFVELCYLFKVNVGEYYQDYMIEPFRDERLDKIRSLIEKSKQMRRLAQIASFD